LGKKKRKKGKKLERKMLAVGLMQREGRMLVMVLMQLTAGIAVVVSVAPFQHCIAFLLKIPLSRLPSSP
jgi:hypothetical protein